MYKMSSKKGELVEDSVVKESLTTAADGKNYRTKLSRLELDSMKRRIEALITFRAAHDKAIRPEAILPLYHVFATGPLTRREFAQMTGLVTHFGKFRMPQS